MTAASGRTGIAWLLLTLVMAAAALVGCAAPATAGPVAGGPTAVATTTSTDPVRLDVPVIGVRTDLLRLGLQADGTVDVPPLESPDAGWYEHSPAPGDVGPAVLLGHVDSARTGPGPFFRLGALSPGDEIIVTRADGSTVTFRVDRVETFPKAQFPSAAVYGDVDRPELRLVTCGGTFDREARSYRDNVVVFATADAREVR